jgi:hypothetical protein
MRKRKIAENPIRTLEMIPGFVIMPDVSISLIYISPPIYAEQQVQRLGCSYLL